MAPAFPVIFTGKKQSNNCSYTCVNGNNMIGKSRNFSSGLYDCTAESEGFGSSIRVETDMNFSEDSCSPRRNVAILNERVVIPLRVMSVSNMSRLERKELEIRLKNELEDVRISRKRIDSFNSVSAIDLSSYSDIRSCSDGLKRVSGHGKKRLPHGRNVSRGKKGLVGRRGQGGVMSGSSGLLMKQCENLLSSLMKHQFGWVFNTPVDVVKLNIPDYFSVIKRPMDLGTVKSKLARGEYSSPLGFAEDVRLTFSNAMMYNPPGNDVHAMAQTLSKHFEQRWKGVEKKIPTNTDMQFPASRLDAPVHNKATHDQIPPVKKQKGPPVGYGKLEPVKRVMTNEEKHKMSMDLEALLAELPENIIEFLKENSHGADQTGEDEIEIDIDALSDDVLFKLRNLLDDFILKKKQSKAEPCEMELHNESGFSNSSIQPGKGNDAADEDVDICGNDCPVSSFLEVEEGNDTANKNSRCQSPSCSSSTSGSSSSDSDLGNSPGNESGGKKAQQVKMQVSVNAEANLGKNRSIGDQDAGRNHSGDTQLGSNGNSLSVTHKESENILSQVGKNPQAEPLSVEFDCHGERESASSERLVSSDKQYRAALLRSRFADTILKAQEKTLEKGEKCDPEKLQLEREERERRKKEEKARLLAEANAAEEARRKAEAEAAAEAKRKRELDREAARLALQKMEKTVDINESSRFLEDLEMLSAAPADNLSSFTDDAIPNKCLNDRLGSFMLGGNSNPLEQLGLYMKDDYEEEEEVDAPQAVLDPAANDAEEGEID